MADALAADAAYLNWKGNVPLTYDWFSHSHLLWPSLSMCWGGVVGFTTAAATAGTDEEPTVRASTVRAVYYATRTGAFPSSRPPPPSQPPLV
jgi:hypothetical protein